MCAPPGRHRARVRAGGLMTTQVSTSTVETEAPQSAARSSLARTESRWGLYHERTDTPREVRVSAAQGLGTAGTPDDLKPLLADTDARVRAAPLTALATTGCCPPPLDTAVTAALPGRPRPAGPFGCGGIGVGGARAGRGAVGRVRRRPQGGGPGAAPPRRSAGGGGGARFGVGGTRTRMCGRTPGFVVRTSTAECRHRVPYDDMRAQEQVLVRVVGGTAEGGADGEAAQLLVGDVDRGERRVQVAGERDVVVPGQ